MSPAAFAIYRGWYAYGARCLADLGHCCLWQPYRILDLGVPEMVEVRPSNEAWVSASWNRPNKFGWTPQGCGCGRSHMSIQFMPNWSCTWANRLA